MFERFKFNSSLEEAGRALEVLNQELEYFLRLGYIAPKLAKAASHHNVKEAIEEFRQLKKFEGREQFFASTRKLSNRLKGVLPMLDRRSKGRLKRHIEELKALEGMVLVETAEELKSLVEENIELNWKKIKKLADKIGKQIAGIISIEQFLKGLLEKYKQDVESQRNLGSQFNELQKSFSPDWGSDTRSYSEYAENLIPAEDGMDSLSAIQKIGSAKPMMAKQLKLYQKAIKKLSAKKIPNPELVLKNFFGVEPKFKKSVVVVDLGCGAGNALRDIINHFKDADFPIFAVGLTANMELVPEHEGRVRLQERMRYLGAKNASEAREKLIEKLRTYLKSEGISYADLLQISGYRGLEYANLANFEFLMKKELERQSRPFRENYQGKGGIYKPIIFKKGDIQTAAGNSLSRLKGKVDVIISSNAIKYTSSPWHVIISACNLLAKGGYAYIFDVGTWWKELQARAQSKNKFLRMVPPEEIFGMINSLHCGYHFVWKTVNETGLDRIALTIHKTTNKPVNAYVPLKVLPMQRNMAFYQYTGK